MTEEPAEKRAIIVPVSQLFSKPASGFNFSKLGTGELTDSPLLYKDSAVILKGGDKGPIHPLMFDILSLGTPGGHEHDLLPILKRYISHKLHIDALGNVFFIVGPPNPTTMFSCHLDTVHSMLTKVSVWSTVGPTEQCNDFIFASRQSKGSDNGVPCNLGADDRVGIYIMAKLANAKTPGLYMFHVGEESGGKGSRGIVQQSPEKFAGIKRCIAFDRKGYNEVVVKQGGKTCASQEFGKALSQAINAGLSDYAKGAGEYSYAPSDNGVFTDSKNYAGIVPECVNLGVGYFDQHQSTEHFDAVWLESILIPSLKAIDFDALPTHRDPKEVPAHTEYAWGGAYQNQANRRYINGVWTDVETPTATWSLNVITEWTHHAKYPDVTPDTVVWPSTMTARLKKDVLAKSFVSGKFSLDNLLDSLLAAKEDAAIANARVLKLEDTIRDMKEQAKSSTTLIAISEKAINKGSELSPIYSIDALRLSLDELLETADDVETTLIQLAEGTAGDERAIIGEYRNRTTTILDEADVLMDAVFELENTLVGEDRTNPIKIFYEVQAYREIETKMLSLHSDVDSFMTLVQQVAA